MFFGDTWLEIEKAKQAFYQGRYQDALEGFLEAQRLHGEPSVVLQSFIGNSYRALGQNEATIHHFTNALEVKDNPTDRINRGTLYMETGQCSPAIEDAKAALTMEPDAGEGIHTDAEANYILAICYAQQSDYLLALQHAEIAPEIAEENHYTAIDLETMSLTKESIQAVLDGTAWPEDLLFEPTLTYFTKGIELLEIGNYEEAITILKTAQEKHGTPSGTIQVLIGVGYRALGYHEIALTHYNNAIEIREDPHHRVSRATEYANQGRCAEATTDAETALSMNPYSEPGYHTSAEAHWILAACSPEEQDQIHMDQALAIARAHGYTQEDIDFSSETVEAWITLKNPDEIIHKQYSSAPEMTIDPSRKYTATITTNRGEIEIALYPSDAPMTVNNFVFLAREGFYDGTPFHRIVKDFMVQTGDPTGTGGGGPGYRFADEPVSRSYTKGIVAMANAGPNTNGSQFFIVHAEDAGLPPTYTIFGEVASGLDTLDAIANTPVRSERSGEISVPTENVVIESIQIQEAEPAIISGRAVPRVSAPKVGAENTSLTSITDLQNAKWLQRYHPETAERVAQLPWVRDGLNAQEEETILDDLLQILTTQSRSGVIMLSGRVNKTVDSILDMPFIQSISPGDAMAIQSLGNIAHGDTARLKTILKHPTFAGGITDEWTPIIAALRGPHENDPSLIPVLLDPRKTTIESRNIELPITGIVELHLIRMGSDRNPETMDSLEAIVKNLEFFMHLPLPVQMVSVLVADSIIPSASGNNFGTGITIRPEHESDEERLTDILAHEVAHYYWSGNEEWIDEGMSELITGYNRWVTTGVPMTASKYPCPHFSNIQQLERAKPRKGEDSFSCNYTLGERVFLDLWMELGDVPFRSGAQRLHEQTLAGDAGVEEVRAAFNKPETVERWYSSAKGGTIRGTDENEPTWKLDEIHGTIDDAGIILAEDGPKVESFSTKSHRGEAFLWFSFSHPTFVEESWTLDLTLVEMFEDGFIYNVNPLEFNVKGTNVGGSWRISVGPGKGRLWKPGVHHVMLYDRGGTKVIHVSWNVTR